MPHLFSRVVGFYIRLRLILDWLRVCFKLEHGTIMIVNLKAKSKNKKVLVRTFLWFDPAHHQPWA